MVTDSPERLTYGDDPSHYGLLYRPAGEPRGTIVVIHGGFWKAQYGVEYATPLAEDLVARGYVAWVPEYRRVGNGGGFPETLDDVHASFAALDATGADTSALIVLGHSAGGHLATWSASRGNHERWGDPAGKISTVISQAGVVDLLQAYREDLGADAVGRFVGPPGPTYALVDPSRQAPPGIPVWCVHALDDDIVPISQSVEYVAQLRAQGGEAHLVEVTGGHMGVVDVASDAWAEVVGVIERITIP